MPWSLDAWFDNIGGLNLGSLLPSALLDPLDQVAASTTITPYDLAGISWDSGVGRRWVDALELRSVLIRRMLVLLMTRLCVVPPVLSSVF